MCTGAEIALLAAAGAGIGGSVMQSNAQNSAMKASANATTAELARQAQLRKEAEAIFAKSTQAASPGEQAVATDKAKQDRGAAYAAAVTPAANIGYAPATGSSAPEVIQSEYKGAGEKAQAYGKQQGDARANLDAFGDNQLFGQIFQGRQGRKLQQVGNYSAGSQNVLGSELAAAKTKAASPWGDLLVAFSKAAASAAAGGAMGGASGPPTNIVPSAMGAPAAGGVGASFPMGGFAPTAFPALY